MKKVIRCLVVLFLVCGLCSLQSCKSKENETTGSLTITVMDQQGNVIVNEKVSIATSLDNLKNKVFQASGYTDAGGSIIFRMLDPKYYWFTTDQYKGIGADKVFSTVDQYVILMVEPL